jgi:hypothetical protein
VSATEFQAFLARLYTNAAFRRVFKLDPAAALDGYFLTPAERDSVTAIDWETLDRFASSLRNKRRGRLERAFPALFAISHPAVETYYGRYHEIYPLRPGESNSDEVAQFGAFIEQTLAGDRQLPGYARDLVRFESTLQELRESVRADARAPADQPPVEQAHGDRPRAGRGVAIARFDYNVSEIDDALRGGQEPDVRNEEEFIVYALRHGERDPRILRVSGPTALVVELCDGERSVSEIVAAVEAHYRQPGLHDSVVDVIRQLADAVILEVPDGALA